MENLFNTLKNSFGLGTPIVQPIPQNQSLVGAQARMQKIMQLLQSIGQMGATNPQEMSAAGVQPKNKTQQYNPQQGAPTPEPTVVPGFQSKNPQLQKYIQQYFGIYGKDVPTEATNIAGAESGLRNDAINVNSDYYPAGNGWKGGATTDYGPFQINDYWQRNNLPKYGFTIQDMYDPQKATQFAADLYHAQGNKFGSTWHGNKFGYQ